MTNDLIHDVEESLKQERLEKIWKEYGPYLIAGVVLAVLFAAFTSAYRSWNDKVNTSQTGMLITAIEEGNMNEILPELTISMRPGQQAVSYLIQASSLLENGKNEEALAVYLKASADSNLPALYKDLTILQAIKLQWSLQQGKPEEERIAPQKLLSQLDRITADKNSPWRYQALLQSALITAHDLGDYALAHNKLSEIRNAGDAPASLQERAEALDHVYVIKAGQAKTEPVEAPASTPETEATAQDAEG